jgi:hypothetical protein
MKLTDFDALSFDCYGTLIDWEAGLRAVLGPWARSRGLTLSDEALLAAYSGQEARAEASHPGEPYPAILARSLRGLGDELGAEVSEADAERLARSVPDWPAFPDSPVALADLVRRYGASGQVLAAGLGSGVDQAGDCLADLGRPAGLRVGFGSIFELLRNSFKYASKKGWGAIAKNT